MTGKTQSLPRVAALVGPFGSGKTSLVEALAFRTGIIDRQGRIKDGTTLGDTSAEARARVMSVETNVVGLDYLGDHWTLLDCPGSVEFRQDTMAAVAVADAAIVVCEPDPARALMVAPILKALDAAGVPHILFINKVDTGGVRLAETLEALQAVSDRPLVLREVPIRDGERVTGFVDLVSGRAYGYRPGQASDLIRLPEQVAGEQAAARQQMLEHLADFDDHLMEELLDDLVPPTAEVYDDLSRDLAADLIVPVLFGSAEADGGITRLWKCLRHELPGPAETAARLGVEGESALRVFKTQHAAHTGKLSFVRVLAGEVADGQTLAGAGRVSGVLRPLGGGLAKQARAGLGEVVALGRLEEATTGALLGGGAAGAWPQVLPPMIGVVVSTEKKGDDVKLAGALAKLTDEDPSLQVVQSAEFGETQLWGQGEIHVQVALERLKSRFGLALVTRKPQVPYKETIRKAVTSHGRHKKQSGGHGQFGDVTLEIRPAGRGEGFAFEDKVVGGAVPRQFISSVADGVADYLRQGPLGFAVVDVVVALTDGASHAVDSSDMAFKTAARIAMAEGMAQAEPVLLEPVLAVDITVPSDFTSKAQRIVSGRRGQILGYDARPDWPGWDVVNAQLPQAEMGDLIVELRSATQGVGSFAWRFDHLQELSGRLADKVVEERRQALA